ncbi:MAG: hypothetical protein RLZZ322_382 [Verrucomicrobiota bacterium]|jgi:hypothetical protein
MEIITIKGQEYVGLQAKGGDDYGTIFDGSIDERTIQDEVRADHDQSGPDEASPIR